MRERAVFLAHRFPDAVVAYELGLTRQTILKWKKELKEREPLPLIFGNVVELSREKVGIVRGRKILVACEPVRMDRGIDGLVGHIKKVFEEDPRDGSVFVFTDRERKKIRLLFYDGEGYWLCTKRLSQGRLPSWPAARPLTLMESHEIHQLLRGQSFFTPSPLFGVKDLTATRRVVGSTRLKKPRVQAGARRRIKESSPPKARSSASMFVESRLVKASYSELLKLKKEWRLPEKYVID